MRTRAASLVAGGLFLSLALPPLVALAVPPTYRVYATREGLVGHTTANGHVIQPYDRFVALPSTTVLNPNGGYTYTVTVRNPSNGRVASNVPVWDVGPWNTSDNYWHSPRAIFTDLPLGLPEAEAAYYDNYNGGRDQFGRTVSNPAGIDLADGTFWTDLGMNNNGWVDVTFNWETAPWAAAYRAQSYSATMTPGSTAIVWAEFTNQGSQTWTHSSTKLGTSGPQDRSSPFCNIPNWLSCSRPTDVDQSSVATGQVGRFTFIMKAPATPGTYVEKFRLVQEGVTWFGPEITWTINVPESGPDTTPPSVPTGLTATAVAVSQINLSWNASTDNVGVAGYDIYRNGAYLTSVTGTSYSNTGLTMGTTYSYRVAAYDAADNVSAQSTAAEDSTYIIIDNVDAGFSASANWATGTYAPDRYGANYRFRSTAAISDMASWNFNLPTADNYEVYAWWSEGTNRSPAAPYRIYYNGGNQAVSVNQQADGGQWNSLGTWNFLAGSNSVKLSCWAPSGYVVIADAVLLIRR
jgi:hypothetical protein